MATLSPTGPDEKGIEDKAGFAVDFFFFFFGLLGHTDLYSLSVFRVLMIPLLSWKAQALGSQPPQETDYCKSPLTSSPLKPRGQNFKDTVKSLQWCTRLHL